MKFKKASDLKYYIYVSTAKLDMLYSQVASSGKQTTSLDWSIGLKAFRANRKSEREDEPDRDDKLKAVIETLEYSQVVGTIDEPKDYVRGTLPMRWGIYRDNGRPTDEPPLVYFGGRTEETVFGFGGSTRHIEGNAGCAATGSRSSTPYLVEHILTGMDAPKDGWNAYRPCGVGHVQMTYEAIAVATDNIRSPPQNLDFLCKTLLRGKYPERICSDREVTRVLLGSPLYVALASPYPEDLSNY
ncbi:MAG: hypothetical protein M3Y57_15470 [Acidobacteriota bacterium]|nr:hypothetical protein [Acidobacteriota bacterium]